MPPPVRPNTDEPPLVGDAASAQPTPRAHVETAGSEPAPLASMPPPEGPPFPLPPPGAQQPQSRPALPDPALEQRAVAALFVALLSLAGLMGLGNFNRGVYIVLFALTAGGVSLWLGGTALARAGKARAARPRGAVVAVTIGALGVVLSVAMLSMFAALGPQLSHYQRCMAGASTIASQQSCSTEFNHTIVHEIAVLQAGGHS